MIQIVRLIALATVLVGAAFFVTSGRVAPPVLPGQLYHANPEIRAQACRDAGVSDLVPRAGDTDWRVRAAAYAALETRALFATLPMRDTPMAERERHLLAWLNTNQPDALTKLCEFYADSRHCEFSHSLVAQCVRCHAPGTTAPAPDFAPSGCRTCHGDIVDQWTTTAHAQTLSHLQLPTVDLVTRDVKWYDFGDRRGITCVGCHEPTGDHATCSATFTTVDCARCHADTATEWTQWSMTPHSRRADWPTGALTTVANDARTCADCHMANGTHHWATRRDPAILRSGIVLTLHDDAVELINLAGHAYPTGTTRRAVDVLLSVDGRPETVLAQLAPDRLPGALASPSPALAPGETRRIPFTADGQHVRVRLIYRRNRFDAESYAVEIASAVRTLLADDTFAPPRR